MKNYVAIALGLFVVIAVIIIGGGLFSNQSVGPDQTQPVSSPSASSNNSTAKENDTTGAVSSAKTYSLQEVSAHNTADDCWMIVSGKVYNFSKYINQHPGGPGMIKYCGADGTTGFKTKDKKNTQDHSSQAYSMLSKYYLGELR